MHDFFFSDLAMHGFVSFAWEAAEIFFKTSLSNRKNGLLIANLETIP